MTTDVTAPKGAWILPESNERTWRWCKRWHGRYRTAISPTAQDCTRCGLRWFWR